MNAKTKKYLIVGGAIVLVLYAYKVIMRKASMPTDEQLSSLDKGMVLEKGSNGLEVAELQRILKEKYGKYLGETGVDKNGIDGDFGTLTETALLEAKGVKAITLKDLENEK